MNLPGIADRIGKAKEYSHLAMLQVQASTRMLQEGDYQRAELFYCLKLLKDVEDNYDRVLKLVDGEESSEEEFEREEIGYDRYYARTEEDYE